MKIIYLAFFSLLINACATSPNESDNVKATSINYLLTKNDTSVFYVGVVGFDGKRTDGNGIKPGPHILYLRALQSKDSSSDKVQEAFLPIKVKLNESKQHLLRASNTENQIMVWVEDEQSNLVSQKVPLRFNKNDVIKLKAPVDDGIERIEIVTQRTTPFQLSRKTESNVVSKML
ncbi:hypothetical protein [Psychrosphaera haliotis]|uniref:Uncharacterized protein n=1 Tax=Psychrosphaera haliotis TaxID=555083 RepID=A0A6N8FAL2_9GAMM|nr:hypothetical protein [Psychrosphaera haliotis]MUH71802.1 hypothetical protein [Psychrosphaera haliotis]